MKMKLSSVAAALAVSMLAPLAQAATSFAAKTGLVLGANVFTPLVPTLFSAAQAVSNEPFGVVAAINTSFDAKGVAKGDTVTVPIAPTRTASDFTPNNVAATGTDATATSVGVQITKSRKVDWNLTGEQIQSLQNATSPLVQEWVRQLLEQGMRTLRNEAEVDAAIAVKIGASRAVGTAGTNPFATNLDALVDARKVLVDNGAPMADLQCVMDTTAGSGLRKQGIIQQAYQAGSDEERRSGNLLRQFGFQLRESAGVAIHTKGTGASYLVNNAGPYPLATRDIAVDTGTGTILQGDVLTFTGDTNKYVVNGALAANSVNIGRPGLRATLADNVALTVGNNYTANLAFERNAIVGVMRPPIMPANPTITQQLITDAKGMTYLLIQIAQYGQITWELHLAWGFKVVQGEHVCIVMG